MRKFLLLLPIIFLLLIPNKNEKNKNNNYEIRSIFISYIEIEEHLKNKDEVDGKKTIDEMINNIYEFGCNSIILQVRPCSDAIYYSNIFPMSHYLTDSDYSFDVLSYFILKCHNKNMKLIAWINPYRIKTDEDTSIINEGHPAYKYLNTDVIYINNGIYYNPAREEVLELIINGVLEVLDYSVDGILFDDYFYPSDDIDKIEYEKYILEHDISLRDYHLMIINNMIKKVYNICHSKNVLFGISPEGNISNNYDHNYADVLKWMSEDDYIDFIMPQLYYGFNNSVRPFADTSHEWEKNLINNNTSYMVALAFYKVGKSDYYAKEGKDEWINNNDILKREIVLSRNISKYKGFALFRYDNIFNSSYFTMNSQMEINNVKKLLKEF